MRESFVPGWKCVWEVVGNRAQRGRFRLLAAVCVARCYGAWLSLWFVPGDNDHSLERHRRMMLRCTMLLSAAFLIGYRFGLPRFAPFVWECAIAAYDQRTTPIQEKWWTNHCRTRRSGGKPHARVATLHEDVSTCRSSLHERS